MRSIINKTVIKHLLILVILIIFPSMNASSAEQSIADAPSAFLPSDTYTFEHAQEGTPVAHDFIIENKGTAPLQILNVQPGCGCTTASFTKEIPPGEKGIISLSLNTKGYGGTSVNKSAYVTTSDPNNASFRLYFRGSVDSFADIKPDRAVLVGQLGNDIKTEMTITPNKRQPFKILEAKVRDGNNIRLELKETTADEGTRYLLTVINIRSIKGSYNDMIYLKTDSKNHPEIQLPVAGEIK
jgi:hypothetical protein